MIIRRRNNKASSPFSPFQPPVATFALFTLLVMGCSKKEVPPAPSPATNVTVSTITGDTNTASRPVAPIIFTEQDKQSRFENVFYASLPAFAPPKLGTPVRVIKNNGNRVEGELVRIDDEGIVISTADSLVSISRNEMNEATRATLYASDFSRFLSEQRVRESYQSAGPISLEELFLNPETDNVKEVRRFSASRMVAKYGPGRQYADIVDAEIFRGQQVFVVDEKDGWICVKTDSGSTTPIGWIPKFASFVLNPEDKAIIEREMKGLIDSGFVIDVNPAKNEAWVDLYEWTISDDATVQGKSRLMAYYCGQQKNSRLYWVSIRDALTGKRLAEYSESKGFKEF
jgi:hypothetical protein